MCLVIQCGYCCGGIVWVGSGIGWEDCIDVGEVVCVQLYLQCVEVFFQVGELFGVWDWYQVLVLCQYLCQCQLFWGDVFGVGYCGDCVDQGQVVCEVVVLEVW